MSQHPYDLPDEVRVEINGPVRIVTMTRPERFNAVNLGLHAGMARVWRQIDDDEDARAVVLTGAGKAFSSGGDFDFFGEVHHGIARRRRLLREARDIITEMCRFPLPVVAAVNGPAVGFGCSVALLADLVVMEEQAYLADPHVSVGLPAADGGVAVWPLLLGMLRVKEYLLLGERIPATLAKELGLANRVVPTGAGLASAVELAERLAALPPMAVQETKRALNLQIERSMAGVVEFALSAESECFGTEDHQAIVRSFQEAKAKER